MTSRLFTLRLRQALSRRSLVAIVVTSCFLLVVFGYVAPAAREPIGQISAAEILSGPLGASSFTARMLVAVGEWPAILSLVAGAMWMGEDEGTSMREVLVARSNSRLEPLLSSWTSFAVVTAAWVGVLAAVSLVASIVVDPNPQLVLDVDMLSHVAMAWLIMVAWGAIGGLFAVITRSVGGGLGLGLASTLGVFLLVGPVGGGFLAQVRSATAPTITAQAAAWAGPAGLVPGDLGVLGASPGAVVALIGYLFAGLFAAVLVSSRRAMA